MVNIRIVRADTPLHNYEARLPILGTVSFFAKDEVHLMSGIAMIMCGPTTSEDSREYQMWYGKKLRMSDDCKDGLQAIVDLRNKNLIL